MINHPRRKVLALCLDGYEHSLGEEMTRAGEMPALARLRARSARFLLDHGLAVRTGLASEHVATGLAPDAARRWAAVHFDPARYAAWQEGTGIAPFPSRLRARTVVFDPPYFALDRCPAVLGVVNWGAHDPGVACGSQPPGLLAELNQRFGPYPAKEWLYGVAWQSPDRAREMGQSLARAASLRAQVAVWLLTERIPDWDLALVTVSEPHSAIEGLWHGIDRSHPLHLLPSAAISGDGVRAVYRAVDALVGALTDALPETTVVLFAMHGMGSNRSDVASMLLLPELLYRRSFGEALFEAPPEARATPSRMPLLGPRQSWSEWVRSCFGPTRCSGVVADARLDSLPWMPAAWYAPYWKDMECFALPSFYDGRIRVNLQGRERDGRVPIGEYEAFCDRVETLLRGCIDPRTGESVVEAVERPAGRDPLRLDATESDLVVVWRGAPPALQHPEFGLVGPAPYRRPGGHTGLNGFAWLSGTGIKPGEMGRASSFDVVPTLIDFLGESVRPDISGRSLFDGTVTIN